VNALWPTDIHLNFLKKENRMDFYEKIIITSSEGILISGDITEAPSVAEILKEMAEAVQKPIYFVLRQSRLLLWPSGFIAPGNNRSHQK
jgi:hypothetical protein